VHDIAYRFCVFLYLYNKNLLYISGRLAESVVDRSLLLLPGVQTLAQVCSFRIM
jgi:hypothetical protein